MKLELSIADDRELRAFIKDLIKSEIVSIARGEVKSILGEVIKEGYVPKNQADIDRVVKEEIHNIVKAELSAHRYTSDVLKETVRDTVNNILRDSINHLSAV